MAIENLLLWEQQISWQYSVTAIYSFNKGKCVLETHQICFTPALVTMKGGNLSSCVLEIITTRHTWNMN